MKVHQSPRMKVFALGLDENQKAEKAADDAKETKIPIDSVTAGVPLQSPAIVLAKAPKRRFNGFTCGILSWFIGACCLVLLCLAISEVAYHRQRDQAFLRLKWAELRQRMLGYELLSQQQELDRMALEKQSPVEALPLRRSDDPIKPKIVDAIQSAIGQNDDAKPVVSSSSEESNDGVKVFSQYANEQNEKFGFLQALMDKIRKHAQSMGLNGDMQVHVVEVKPLFGGEKYSNDEANVSFERSLADGFGEYAMPHQDFGAPINDAYDNNDRLTFDRHSMRRPFGPFNRFDNQFYDDYAEQEQQQPQQFQWNMPPPQFGFQQQPANWWGPQQRQPMEVQTNQWNDDSQQPRGFPGFPPVPVVQFQQQQQAQQPPQPWYQPYNDNQNQQMNMGAGVEPVWQQNTDWMMSKTQEHQQEQQQQQPMPFQPNPAASHWNGRPASYLAPNNDFSANMDVISDDAAAPQTDAVSAGEPVNEKVNAKTWVQPADDQPAEENVISPDPTLEAVEDGKFLPIRSDDKPIDAADAHLFQIDDPSSFKR